MVRVDFHQSCHLDRKGPHMRFQTLQKPLALLISLALVLGLVPAPALAEALEALEEEPVAAVESDTDGALAEASDADDLQAQAAYLNDPFYFAEYGDPQATPVTTLHTSGTYVLRRPADDSPYTDELYQLVFRPADGATDIRGNQGAYDVTLKTMYAADGETVVGYLLENLATFAYGGNAEWQLPSGRFSVALDDGTIGLSQRYEIASDGNFVSYANLAGNNNGELSVKPYTEDGEGNPVSDAQYDGWYYDEEGVYHYYEEGDAVDEQSPFAPASETRIKITVDTAVALGNDAADAPQLESVGLWKTDEGETVEHLQETYGDLSDYYISRASEISDDYGTAQEPAWPTYLNFATAYDDNVTTLWEREPGDESAVRFVPDRGASARGYFIFDKADFSDAQVDDGVYFPVVRMSYHGESYTFAYYPVEVDATGAAERSDPRITTKAQLPAARVGEAYEATLAAKAGARPAGTFSWALAAGSALPDGLALDSATGTITGTPEAGTDGAHSFAITLTETANDEPRSVTKTFSLRVRKAMDAQQAAQELALGDPSYTPGTIWCKPAGEAGTYLTLELPISLDVTEYDLDETELWYLVELEVGEERTSRTYVFHKPVAGLYKVSDRSMLSLPVLIQGSEVAGSVGIADTKAVKGVRMFLVPKDAQGNYAFDLGEPTGMGTGSDGHAYETEPPERTLAFHFGRSTNRNDYRFVEGTVEFSYPDEPNSYYPAVAANLPAGCSAALDDPDVALGSWVGFPKLSFAGDDEGLLASTGRVTLWSFDGTDVVGEPQVQEFTRDKGASFAVAPGTYAFSVEAETPTYDEYGVEQPEMRSWVDVGDTSKVLKVVPGSNPRQYVFSIGPNEGRETEPKLIDMTYVTDALADVNRHSVVARFELENGDFADSRTAGVYGTVKYQVNWYRRTGEDEADEASYLLVGTGDTAILASSAYPLYVEVVPIGRDNAFWVSKRQRVSEKSRTVVMELARKRRFTGTFELSCASGETPAPGEYWGIIEVQTPTNTGDITTYNFWASDATIEVPNLTSGAKVTFTPTTELKGAQVSYTVGNDAREDFAAELEAPLAAGLISFGTLRFVDARGKETTFTLDDGYTGIEVRRGTAEGDGTYNYGVEEPFYLLDGTSIILQSEGNDGPSFLDYSSPTRYEVILTHKDASAPERLGAMASDVAARTSFFIELSQDETAATIGDATLTSRGYALVPLEGIEPRITSLALYQTVLDENGEVISAALVDKAPAGTYATESDLRTPFLEAGTYTLLSVYADALGQGIPYENFWRLDFLVSGGQQARGARIDFEVADGTVTDLGTEAHGGSGFGAWCAAALAQEKGLVDKSASHVTAEVAYTNMASIQMHAELAKGVKLSEEAKLEIVTNQASGESGQGYMHPRSLTINGKALTLNRWENLFRQTQNMYEGNLEILLAEAEKQGARCAEFPMDLTLIVPLAQAVGSIDVGIWLVDGDTRTMVGSCRKQISETELVVSEEVAWTEFSVYGETGSRAYVTIFVNGMQAATARADRLGYYVASITLPDDVESGDQFALTATAQWTDDGVTSTMATEAQWTTYTTSLPVLERITLCYQYLPGEPYRSTVSYYRGCNPNKYERIYRAENEFNPTTGEHAKQFWVVEFANARGVTDVEVVVPRASGDIRMEATDSIGEASTWIDDVRYAASDDWYWYVGKEIRDALTSTEPHGFVSKPTYFATAPDKIAVDYKIDLDAIRKPGYQTVVDLGAEDGAFRGYDEPGLTADLLGECLDTMADGNYLRFLTDEDVARMEDSNAHLTMADLTATDAIVQGKLGKATGCDDGWLLLGDGTSDGTGLLLLHHESRMTTPSAEEMRVEFEGLVGQSASQRAAYRSWLESGDTSASVPDVADYKGNKVVLACDGSVEGEQEPSCRAYIVSEDDAGNAQWEMLNEYGIYGVKNKKYYTYQRMDKGSLTYITWDEANLRRIEVTYDIYEAQVNQNVVGFDGLYWQWNVVLLMIQNSLDAATLPEGEYESLYDGVDAGEASEEEALGGYKENLAGELFGYIRGDAALTLIAKGADYLGIKSTDQNMKEAMDFRRRIGDEEYVLQRTAEEGSRAWMFREAWDIAQRQTVNNVGNGAYNAATFTPSLLSFVLLFNPISPTEEAINTVQKGKGNPVNKKQTVSHKEKEQPKKPQKPMNENMSDDQLFNDYYWPEWIKGHTGGQSDMTKFWVLKQYRLKRLDAKLEKYLREQVDAGNIAPKVLQEYLQQKQVNDPSGVVYEGVLSNVVEGATVTLYTYNPDAEALNRLVAESGNPDAETLDTGVFVDAERYGVAGDNPQVTGADGRYQWYVPEGFWQVRVSKEGYEDFSSGQAGHEEQWPVYGEDGEQVVEDGVPQTRTVLVGDFGVGATKDLDGDGTDDAAEYWMPVLPVQLDVNIPLVSRAAPEVVSLEAEAAGLELTFSKYMKVDSVQAGDFTLGGVAATVVEPLDAEPAGDGSTDADGNPVMLASRFRVSYPEDMTFTADGKNLAVAFDSSSAQSYAGTPAAAKDSTKVDAGKVPQVDAPTATIGTQTYGKGAAEATARNVAAGSTLTLATATKDATLYYTTDGSDPRTNLAGRKVYTGAIRLTADADLAIAACKKGMVSSPTLRLHVRLGKWVRLWGQNALDTMQSIAGEFGSAKVAVVTTNAGFKDALAASAFAGQNGALVLTTAKGSASAQTKAALKAAGVTTVYVVGTTADVSAAAANGLKYKSGVTVKRVANKSGVSAKAVELAKACTKHGDTVIIATQGGFKDALSVAPYSYAAKAPILYAETNKTLSAATLSYIKSAGYTKAIIVGGPVALPASIETQLTKNTKVKAANITRLAGSNSYATSEVIAKWATGQYRNNSTVGTYKGKPLATIKFQPKVKLSANRLGVATSQSWKDALCGAALCGKTKSVLLLADDKTSGSDYSRAVAFCKANKTKITRAYVLGGPVAVSDKVLEALVASTVV